MRKHLSLVLVCTLCALGISCHENTEVYTPNHAEVAENDGTITRTFAEPDNAKELKGTPSENLKAILETVGPGIITSLGSMNITEGEYNEIKAFTDELVAGKTTQTEKYKTIFNWVYKNLTFNDFSNPAWYNMGNDPYEVFTNRVAVCQGYSNLMTVMCHSQGIPTMVVNGLIYASAWNIDLGHAWAYTYPDSTWIVSDPTNNGYWKMSDIKSYTHLKPQQVEFELYRDNSIVCEYSNFAVNIKEVLQGDDSYTLPYSAMGFVINSFNPTVELPENITEIYVGQNITSLGTDDNMKLFNNGKHLQAMYVDKNNPTLMDNKGIVYKKNGNSPQLYYIPGGMTFIELLPMEIVDKNTIYSHMSVEEIYFPEGTKRLENYAIENCPKLKRIYVPADAVVAKEAIYNVPNEVEIVRGTPSGITHVTMD